MKIITGHTGEKHVYAVDDAAIHKLLVGDGDYVLPYGNTLNLTETDSHAVSIGDGYLITQGRLAVIRAGEDETFDLADGSNDYYMAYLIVAEYNIDDDGVESIELKALAGPKSSTEETADPDLTTGNIDLGQTHQMALWRVKLNGRNIMRTERVTAVVSTSPLNDIYNAINQMQTDVADAISNMNTTATTTLDNIQTNANNVIKGWSPFYYQKGSTINITNEICSGFITNDRKFLDFQIPTKPIINGSLKINSLSVEARMCGYYPYIKSGNTFTQLASMRLIVQNGKVTYVKGVKNVQAWVKNGGIQVRITTSDRLYKDKKTIAANNEPVAIKAHINCTVV